MEVVQTLEEVVEDHGKSRFIDVPFQAAVNRVHGTTAAKFHANLSSESENSQNELLRLRHGDKGTNPKVEVLEKHAHEPRDVDMFRPRKDFHFQKRLA